MTDLDALDDIVFPSNKSIVTYSATWYDAANRPIRSGQIGTNAAGFQSGGTAPTVTQSTPPDPDPEDPDVQVTATSYGARGPVERMTDPMGRITRFHTAFLAGFADAGLPA